jgi:hypothetical protein
MASYLLPLILCSTEQMRTWYVLLVLLLWLAAGAALLLYCLLSTANPNIATLLQVLARIRGQEMVMIT